MPYDRRVAPWSRMVPIRSTMEHMRRVLRGVITFALLLVGISLILELNERDHRVGAVVTGLTVAYLLGGSLVKLWRALRHGDLSVTSQSFWLPRRWQAWMYQGSADDKRPRA